MVSATGLETHVKTRAETFGKGIGCGAQQRLSQVLRIVPVLNLFVARET